MPTQTLQETLLRVKELPLQSASTTLYIGTHRISGQNRAATYRLSTVRCDAALSQSIKSDVIQIIESANEIGVYEPLDVDNEGTILFEESLNTEWSLLSHAISNANPAASVEDLKESNFMVVCFSLQSHSLFTVKRLSEKWTAKRLKGLQGLFRGGLLQEVTDGHIFRFERGIDFFYYDSARFILNRINFERILNIRVGLETARNEAIQSIQSTGKFEGIEILSDTIQNKMPLMRRIASVRNSGNLENDAFLNALFDVIQQYGQSWQISITDGKIIITPDNAISILHLLNNDRVTSVIDQCMFDAIVKKPVGN